MSGDAGSEHDRSNTDERKEQKEGIVDQWAIPGENPGSIHQYYRGELSRANTWRTRLDASTNWAVVTTGVLISVAFSSSRISHSILLAEIPVIALFLLIESRRFRKYDLHRSRGRLIEQNYFSTLFASETGERLDDWQRLLANNLHDPTFQLRLIEAVSTRIRRNYIWLLGVMSGVWGLKLIIHPTPATNWSDVVYRAGIAGLIPYWMNWVLWGLLWAVILVLAFWRPAPVVHREGRPIEDRRRWKI